MAVFLVVVGLGLPRCDGYRTLRQIQEQVSHLDQLTGKQGDMADSAE